MSRLNEKHIVITDSSPLGYVLGEVVGERKAQDEKWGEQNHPDGTGDQYMPHARFARSVADVAAREGALTWKDILCEEFYEALAEHDPEKLRTELVQVAAVATAWAEAIDRRQS